MRVTDGGLAESPHVGLAFQLLRLDFGGREGRQKDADQDRDDRDNDQQLD